MLIDFGSMMITPGSRALRRPFLRAWEARPRPAHVNSRPRTSSASAHQEPPAAGPAATSDEPTAAYVHLPFCKRKCRYCDFPVIAVGMNPPEGRAADNMEMYVDLLCREIEASRKLNPTGPLKTVFFGGGTPSLISLPLLERILRELDARFGIAVGAEVSIEADPGTFDAGRLRSYMTLGINRISVGVQSFQEDLLALLGRGHDLRDVYRAIEAVYAAAVPSWSLDLMSGLPHLTPEQWQASLEAALDADPHHLSVYDLQVEEHTPFAKLYRPGVSPLPADDVAAAMYCTASGMLRREGYEHYEVSNYAKPGHRCAHNMVYWEGGAFYGFGMGSASYLQGRRFSRPKRLHAYRRWVDELVALGELSGSVMATRGSGYGPRGGGSGEAQEAEAGPGAVPGLHLPPESAHDKLLDTVMLRLRLAEGLDLRSIAGRSLDGEPLSKVVLRALEPRIEQGLVELLPADPAQAPGPAMANSISSSSGNGGGQGGPAGAILLQQGQGRAEGRSGSGGAFSSGGGGNSSSSTAGGELVRVKLRDPEGFVVSNDVISDVFAALDDSPDEE